MQDSLTYWLTARYKASVIAMDAAGDGGGGATIMQEAFGKLSARWQAVFDKFGQSLAKRMTNRVLSHSDNALQAGLRGQSFAVEFTMTPEMRQAYEATIGENVALIKSIASQHLGDVEGLVMRSVAKGGDMGELSKALRDRYGVTKRRAALIARDQNAKATTTMLAARQQSIGITEGIWRHSHAGKVPRPSHVKANGEVFKLNKGLYLDGEWLLPSQAINCRCYWSPKIPGIGS